MAALSKNFLLGAVIVILLIIMITFGALLARTKQEVRIKDQEVRELQKRVEQLQVKLTEQKAQIPYAASPALSELEGWGTYRSEGDLKFEIWYPAHWAYSDLEPMTPEDFFVCFMDEKYNFEGGECRGGPSFALQNQSFGSEEVKASRIFSKEDAVDDTTEINFIEGGVKFYAECDSQIIDACNQILSTFKFIKK